MGCTSGHMLCGMSRMSAWSTTAVAIFFPMAMVTHHLVHPTLLTEVCNTGLPCYTPTYPTQSTTATLLALVTAVTLAGRLLPSIIAEATKGKGKPGPSSTTIARQATELLAGLQFGLGLHTTQMAHPAKVLSFLSFPNLAAWDPSMALVILFGILPNLLEIQWRGLQQPPVFNSRFELPDKSFRDVDWRFVLGAAVFGIGWGLTGTCPGPAVLRSFVQPVWGLLWVGGFWAGGQMAAEPDAAVAVGTCG